MFKITFVYYLLFFFNLLSDIVSITIISSNFSPWDGAPYKDAAEKTALGGLALDGFLSEVCVFQTQFFPGSKHMIWLN